MPASVQLSRLSGYVRALGVLAVLLGVAVMHSAVFGAGHAMAESPAPVHAVMPHGTATVGVLPAGEHTTTTDTVRAVASVPRAGAPTAAEVALDPECAGCTAHGGMHTCVFILVALALALGLMVIARLGADRARGAGRVARSHLRRRTRPPPWTVLSLADLAILRI